MQCNPADVTCRTQLLLSNDCSLNVGVLAYGVLGQDVGAGYCVNNASRRGEACLRGTRAYPAGARDGQAGDVLFDGLQPGGLHYFAW